MRKMLMFLVACLWSTAQADIIDTKTTLRVTSVSVTTNEKDDAVNQWGAAMLQVVGVNKDNQREIVTLHRTVKSSPIYANWFENCQHFAELAKVNPNLKFTSVTHGDAQKRPPNGQPDPIVTCGIE